MKLAMVSRLLLSILTLLAVAGCGASESGSQAGKTESQRTESEAVSPPPSTSTTSATKPAEQVRTAGPLGDLVYRPTMINLGDGYSIHDIRWRSYGGPTAVGTAVRSADGKQVTITLRGIYDCGGGPTYLKWSVQPAGAKAKPEFTDIMSPHEWNETCYPEPEPEDYPSSVGED